MAGGMRGSWLYAKYLVYTAHFIIDTLGVLFTFFTLKRKELKCKEVKELAPGHTATRSKG